MAHDRRRCVTSWLDKYFNGVDVKAFYGDTFGGLMLGLGLGSPGPSGLIVEGVQNASGPWRATPNVLIGSAFTSGPSLKVELSTDDGSTWTSCTAVSVTNSTHVAFTTPPQSANVSSAHTRIRYTNGDGQQATLGAGNYAVAADPVDMPSLSLWMHVADLSDGAVASWTEHSGTGRVFTAGGTTPTKSTSPNLINFGGAGYLKNAFTAFPTSDVLGAGSCSFAFKYQLSSVPAAGNFCGTIALLANHGGSAWGSDLILSSLGGGYANISFLVGSGGGAAVGINVTLDTSAHTIVVVWDGISSSATSSYAVYLDGTSQTVVSSGTFASYVGDNVVGARGQETLSMVGKLGDIVACKTNINATQAAALASYLATA